MLRRISNVGYGTTRRIRLRTHPEAIGGTADTDRVRRWDLNDPVATQIKKLFVCCPALRVGERTQ